jgi:dihydroflavonol-4-reductase
MAHLFVTGATGHLGAWIVRDLHANGHTTVSLVRQTSDRRGLAGTGTIVVNGDLRDGPALARAMDGCDGVIHAGAVHRNATRDPNELLGPAIEGTRNVIEAAAAAGIRRVVHCSSNATVGYGQTDVPLDESSFFARPTSAYIRGKVESERLALALGPELGVEIVVVNPSGVLGPWDLRITPTTKGIVDMARAGFAVVDVTFTHVADVASGHRLAWERGVPGERYLLAGDHGLRARVAWVMSSLLDRRMRTMSPPYSAVWAVAYAQEKRFALGGPEPDVTRAILADLGRDGHLLYDATKARRDLGWTSRPLEEILRDTLRWLAHRGHLGSTGEGLRAKWPADPDWPASDV